MNGFSPMNSCKNCKGKLTKSLTKEQEEELTYSMITETLKFIKAGGKQL